MSNSKRSRISICAGFLITALFVSGCGKINNKAVTSSSSDLSNLQTNYTSPATSNNSNDSSSFPPLSKSVQGSGYTSVSVTVSTGQRLRVRFTPMDPGMLGYSQLGVFLTVGSTTLDTSMLQVGSPSGVLDFSSAISKNCSTSSCRQDVTIQIGRPNYDLWCRLYGSYCPYNRVSQGHPWGGTLTIATDDTKNIQ